MHIKLKPHINILIELNNTHTHTHTHTHTQAGVIAHTFQLQTQQRTLGLVLHGLLAVTRLAVPSREE